MTRDLVSILPLVLLAGCGQSVEEPAPRILPFVAVDLSGELQRQLEAQRASAAIVKEQIEHARLCLEQHLEDVRTGRAEAIRSGRLCWYCKGHGPETTCAARRMHDGR